MTAEIANEKQRVRRLLRLLYREDLRAAAYRAYRRRARHAHHRKLLITFGQVEGRVIGLLEGHLAALGYGRPGRPGLLRRLMASLGTTLGTVTALGGERAMLRRLRSEETRGADRYAREVDWDGWTPEERDTLDGYRCDQLYQNQWAEDVERDLRGKGTRAVP